MGEPTEVRALSTSPKGDESIREPLRMLARLLVRDYLAHADDTAPPEARNKEKEPLAPTPVR